MNDAYRPPNSDLDHDLPKDPAERQIYDETQALRALYKAQQVFWSPLIAFLSTVFLLVLLALYADRTPMLVFLLPGFIAGYLIKYLGSLIKAKHRIVSGLIVGGTVFSYVLPSSPAVAAVVGVLNCAVFIFTSRRPLTLDEEKLLSKHAMGRLKP